LEEWGETEPHFYVYLFQRSSYLATIIKDSPTSNVPLHPYGTA